MLQSSISIREKNISLFFNLFLSAAKKVEQNKAKTLASMGLKTHFARVAINLYF
jgi:hypothetical protein